MHDVKIEQCSRPHQHKGVAVRAEVMYFSGPSELPLAAVVSSPRIPLRRALERSPQPEATRVLTSRGTDAPMRG